MANTRGLSRRSSAEIANSIKFGNPKTISLLNAPNGLILVCSSHAFLAFGNRVQGFLATAFIIIVVNVGQRQNACADHRAHRRCCHRSKLALRSLAETSQRKRLRYEIHCSHEPSDRPDSALGRNGRCGLSVPDCTIEDGGSRCPMHLDGGPRKPSTLCELSASCRRAPVARLDRLFGSSGSVPSKSYCLISYRCLNAACSSNCILSVMGTSPGASDVNMS
jgi:hypothetical protein